MRPTPACCDGPVMMGRTKAGCADRSRHTSSTCDLDADRVAPTRRDREVQIVALVTVEIMYRDLSCDRIKFLSEGPQ